MMSALHQARAAMSYVYTRYLVFTFQGFVETITGSGDINRTVWCGMVAVVWCGVVC